MIITIFVESEGQPKLQLSGTYKDVLSAEEGLKKMVEGYLKVEDDEHDCKLTAEGTGHCEHPIHGTERNL